MVVVLKEAFNPATHSSEQKGEPESQSHLSRYGSSVQILADYDTACRKFTGVSSRTSPVLATETVYSIVLHGVAVQPPASLPVDESISSLLAAVDSSNRRRETRRDLEQLCRGHDGESMIEGLISKKQVLDWLTIAQPSLTGIGSTASFTSLGNLPVAGLPENSRVKCS